MIRQLRVSVRLILLLSSVWFIGCSQQEDSQPAQSSTEPTTTIAESAAPSGESSSTEETTTAKAESTETESTQTADATDTAAPASDAGTDAGTEAGTEASTTPPPAETQQQTVGDHEAQLALANKSGCLACHAVDKKLVGPAWRDVSKRYKDDPEAKTKLIAKVSKGGRGNWTEVVGAVAMPPYSPRVSDENIALLVDFVLSLEK